MPLLGGVAAVVVGVAVPRCKLMHPSIDFATKYIADLLAAGRQKASKAAILGGCWQVPNFKYERK